MKSSYRPFSSLLYVLIFAVIALSAIPALAQHPPYNAHIRIFLVEPLSRWLDYNFGNYHMGTIDIAYDTAITIDNQVSLDRTINWNGAALGFGDIQQNNIMAIAVIYSGDYTTKYSDPPLGSPFLAHFVDAAAAATPDSQWNNSTNGGFTHTVFAEIGTGSWCKYCPATNNAMHGIFSSHIYNYFYAELIEDKNVKAHNRAIGDFNIAGFPTTYVDGGDQMLIGGEAGQNPYISLIEMSGVRDVHSFDLSTHLDWLGGGNLSIQLHLKNNEIVNRSPTVALAPVGNIVGGPNANYTFKTATSDPDGDQLYYRFCWKTGDTSIWMGPYNSGDTCAAVHKWTDSTVTQVTVMTKDEYDGLTGWSDSLQVVIRSYLAGDVNHNGVVNLLDITYMISYLYKQGPFPIPLIAGDINGNNQINLLDATYLISFLYKGGPAPKYPA